MNRCATTTTIRTLPTHCLFETKKKKKKRYGGRY